MKQNRLVADYLAKKAEIFNRISEDPKPKIASLTSHIENKTMWIIKERTSFDKPAASESEINKVLEEIALLRADRDTLKLQIDRQDEFKAAAVATLDEKYPQLLTESFNKATPREVELCRDIAKTLEKLQTKVYELSVIRGKKHEENELVRKITNGPVAMDIHDDLKRFPGMANDLHPVFSKFIAMFIQRLSDKSEGPLYDVQLEDRTYPPPALTREEKAAAKAKIKQAVKDSAKRRADSAVVHTQNPKLGEDMSTGNGF